jgi:type II secretory pathway pseudopilin PulG
MEGKGWFVIYGILALIIIYLFIAQQSLGGKVNQLQADVAALRNAQQAPAPEPSSSSSPGAEQSPNLSNAAGRDQQREDDLRTINEALKKYYDQKKQYPNSLQQLVPNYLASLPKDPLSPKYSYRYVKTPTGYSLTAYLETSDYPDDRADGKQDHILTFTEKTS